MNNILKILFLMILCFSCVKNSNHNLKKTKKLPPNSEQNQDFKKNTPTNNGYVPEPNEEIINESNIEKTLNPLCSG